MQTPTDITGVTLSFDRGDGSDFKFMAIPGTTDLNRYLAVAANPGGTSPSFNVTAWIQGEKPEAPPVDEASYADNITFSATA